MVRSNFFMYWAFICVGLGKYGVVSKDQCLFKLRRGEVRISILTDEIARQSSSGASEYACKVTTSGTSSGFNTYILIAFLRLNKTCPAGKTVSFSFTSPRFTENFHSFPSDPSDCAVVMSQPSNLACTPYPLADCVSIWEFKTLVGEIQSGEVLSVEVPVNGQNTQNITFNNTDCDCPKINHILGLPGITQIHNLYKTCILGKKSYLKRCKSLQLVEGAMRTITNSDTLSLNLGLISATVTSGDSLEKNFFISLPSGNKMVSLQSTSLDDDVTMEVPQGALDQIRNRSGGPLNMGTFWFQENSMFPVEQENISLLRSRVVALDLGQDVSGLENPVNLTFSLQNTTLNTTLQCVFWDVKDAATANWNSSGCTTDVVAEGKVICSCNHLSFFAVLLTPVGVVKPLSAASIYNLTVLSRVGCSVSLAFLVLMLLSHAFYQRGPTDNSLWIHLHVCVSLLLLNLTFLINDFLTALHIPAVCIAMAALTHYAQLSMLTWFAIEGLHLYLLFIRVFNIHVRRYLLKLSLLGWGLPAVPVAVVVGLNLYGESKIENVEGGSTSMCFMKKENLIPQILTYCYFLLVLIFNVTMFSVVLNQLLKARLHSPMPQDKGLNRGMVLSLLALSWMLGISWGIMTFGGIAPLQEISFYIFCSLNGLHGLFLFLRYCSLLRKEKLASSSTNSALATAPNSSKS
ncbi:adhesion G protein-coupled receptor G3-like [Sardina pilchardus]|uniref:adhesion G protein-coupled receptor G3-like n=1 Tax=Sardina pilchardus TaxID=27697 RepID=UPI002E0D3974